jgi:hypothetical protein
MWAHPNLPRSISTERRDDSSTTVPKRRTQSPFPSSHSQRNTTSQPKGKSDNRPDSGRKTNHGFKFSYLFLSSIIFLFLLFLFTSDYFTARRKACPPYEAGMEQRAVERHEMSFLVLKYFHKPTKFFLLNFFTPFVCGVASLLVYGKRQGDGMSAINTLLLLVFFLAFSCRFNVVCSSRGCIKLDRVTSFFCFLAVVSIASFLCFLFCHGRRSFVLV